MLRDRLAPFFVAPPRARLGQLRRLERIVRQLAVASILAYGLITLVVARWPRWALDVVVFEWIDGRLLHRGPVSYVLSHLGSAPVLTPLVVVACAYLVLRRRALAAGAILGISYGVVGVLVTLGKTMLRRPEPTKAADAAGYAYPSGHAAAAVVAWGGLALAFYVLGLLDGESPRRRVFLWAGTVVGIVCLVSLLRSAHWLTDIAGGIAVGLVSLTIAAVVVLRLWLPRQARALAAGVGSER